MHPTEYDRLAAHEGTYWWFVAKRRLVKEVIQRYGPPSLIDRHILDVGCGAGANLAQLQSLTRRAVGIDFSPHALKYAAQHHRAQLAQADALQLPLAGQSVDVITCLDVLYHRWLPDDEAALAEYHRVLKPGGLLILTDSAFASLSGLHDETNLAARRYTLPQMRAKLRRRGFRLEKASYLYFSLFPIALLRRWLQRALANADTPVSDVQPLPAPVNALALKFFMLEFAWLKVGRLPFGTSIFFVARKPPA